jgi:signal transduction histidine kinase/CheY-like chemotaxis protein
MMIETLEKTADILVVDDEVIVTSLIRDALEDEGYEIETASSGESALELVNQHHFDLVISDIRMPRMDGIELIKRIREHLPNISIIFMTGYANLQSAKNAIKQGASDYIMKPFELTEMRAAVKNALKMKRAADESTSDHHLDHLTDLTRMLFEAGDRRGLIVASLRFAMIHQRSERGTVIYLDDDTNEIVLTTFHGDKVSDKRLPAEPIATILDASKLDDIKKPYIVNNMDDYHFWEEHPNPALKEYFLPDWHGSEDHLIFVPVIRGGVAHCCMLIQLTEDTIRLRETNMKFLFMVASQLAITLENLILLDQSRKAYARLRELQDQTIELEKLATRGEISARIGHEVNNFMGVISGNISLLEDRLKKEQYDMLGKYIENIAGTITRIKTFTDSLMDLTPISSKKVVLKFDDLLSEVIEFIRPQRRYQGITIHMRHVAHDLWFEADSTQIQQLLYNLFNNAADAMASRDTRTITVDLELTNEPDEFRFRLTDTGQGINPDYLKKAFREQFTTKASGHGLGLLVCGQVIKNHGGQLDIQSEINKGTTITILFPMAHKPELQPA